VRNERDSKGRLNVRTKTYQWLTGLVGFGFVGGAIASGCGGGSSDLGTALVPAIGFASPTQITSGSSAITLGSRASGLAAALTTPDMRARIEGILGAGDIADCFADTFNFQFQVNDAECYGPQLVYADHPGGSPTMDSCGPVTPTPSGHSGCLPGRDLGVWSATNGTSGEACSAAQLNALVNGTAGAVNTGLEILAGVSCVLSNRGVDLPAAGSTLDVTEELDGVSEAITFTSASLERESVAHSSGGPIYKLTVAATVSGQEVHFTIRNTESASGVFGQFFGDIKQAAAAGYYGFSVVYSDDGELTSFEMRSATTPEDAGRTNLIGTDNRYSFATFLAEGSGQPDNSNARHMIATVDNGTGAGTVNFAWQAGGSDDNTRVFRAKTAALAAATAGYAYFGFGPAINSASVGTIDGMCCNWAGPGASCTVGARNSANVQAQSFASSGGVLTPSDSKITYAPTNNCDANSAGTFKYAIPAVWNGSGSSVSATNVTNNLTSQTQYGAVDTLTAPTF